MANFMKSEKQRPPTAGSSAYPMTGEPLRIPKTPLESRQGFHPKTDEQLRWRGPPTRQLTRQRRIEYESDIRERFYDDYIGERRTGDAGNAVETNLAKKKFHPDYYRVNAYQGLIYDPMRPVPKGLNFAAALDAERGRQRSRQYQRRLSDSFLLVGRPGTASMHDPSSRMDSGLPPLLHIQPAATQQQHQPRYNQQKSLADEALNPEAVQGVEDWLSNASAKEKSIATNFLRTLSSHGKRPDPATKATVHRTRVRSAVMTPTRKMRANERLAQNEYQKISKKVDYHEVDAAEEADGSSYRRRRSRSNEMATKGSMFNNKKELPSHFTVHPEWASETTNTSHKRK